MPGNATPQFTRNGNVSGVAITAANTNSEGVGTIGTTSFLAFTADATNGSFVDTVRFFATASAAATATTATVGRIFISSLASGTTAATNTFCIGEVWLPVLSADSSTQPNSPIDFPVGFRIPPGWTILVTNHAVPAASTQWIAVVIGGDY